MKKIFSSLFAFICINITAQVGIGTTNPNFDSALEVSSNDKAILITKLLLLNTNNPSPLTSHVAGMIVYNTNTNGSGDSGVSPGFYYNNGIKWIKIEPLTIHIGDIKHSIATVDHLGWYKLDGRLISSLPISAQTQAISLGFTTNLPDATDKILKSKSNNESLATTGGSNTILINQAHLPNVNFLGTTSTDGNHSHTYVDRHNSNIENINVVYGLLGILSSVVLNILNTNVGNKVSANSNTNSSDSGNHSHSVTVSSGGSNAPLPLVKNLSTNTFIYLGE